MHQLRRAQRFDGSVDGATWYSATMTLDLYGHLFPDRLDTVADAMDAARTVALNVAAEAGTGHRRDTAAVVPIR